MKIEYIKVFCKEINSGHVVHELFKSLEYLEEKINNIMVSVSSWPRGQSYSIGYRRRVRV